MVNRIKALTVVLDEDYREDDCKPIIEAIRMIGPVLEVRPKVGSDRMAYHMAKADLKSKLLEKIVELFNAEGMS